MAKVKNFPNNVDEYQGAEPVMKWLHGRTSGVFGADEGLAVSANDNMTVSVSDGPGWLSNAKGDGCVFWNDTEETTGSKLTLDVGLADPSLPRIDRVIATWDTIKYDQWPSIEILQGTPASDPQPPALTNSTLKRQISLAQYRVAAAATKITAADITDERLDPEVCGLVTDQVGIDTSVMQAQFTALLALIRAELERLNAGTETMLKTTYDTDRRGRNIFGDIPYLYKATFDMDAWEGSEKVSQTATLTAVDGGGPVTADSILLPEMGTASNLPAEAKDAMQSAAVAILKATKTLGADTITVELDSAPDVDVELYFLVKKGDGENVPPPLDPVGGGGHMKLVWSENNPRPFSTKNIPVGDLSEFDLVLIVYYIDASYKKSLSNLILPNNGTTLTYSTYSGSNVYGLTRTVTYVDGSYSVTANKVDNRNDVILPTKIYGIKL